MIRVLHLEDSEDDAALVARALRGAGLEAEITRATGREDFILALQEGPFDLVVSDFSLPGFDGLEALGLVREQDAELPFVFVSGTIGEERAVGALRFGATDYVLKNSLSRFPSAVRRSLEERHEREAHRRAEERIREQAALLDEAQDAISVRDLEGRVTYWSQGARRLFGWSADEACAGAAEARIPAEAGAAVERAWAAVLDQGRWHGTFELRTRDGSAVIVDSHWTCLRHADGRPRAVLDISRDVTQARQLEAQLLRKERLETIGMLAGGVAHDLNNVLAPLLMGISSLRRMVTEERGLRLLDTMETSAARGADILRQVLTFARGTQQPLGAIDVGEAIRELEPLLHATFPKSIQFDLEIAAGLPRLTADPTQLQQVVLNLCVNARDAMLKGGRLSIRLEPFSASGADYLRLRVKDSGEGMAAELQQKIFEPFYTTKSQGTGIGLATVASIVERHGGFIEVESVPGQGTEFRVHLPVRPAPIAIEAAPAAHGRGELLLVLEKGAVREILRQTLDAYGYRVVCCENEEQVLHEQAHRAAEVAAVLIDLSLPELANAALVRGLLARDPAVKIIDTGGRPGAEPRIPGVCATLTKPFSAETLLSVVVRVLDIQEG